MADLDMLRVRAEARLGSVLRDKWRLDALLGIGGMAAVYAATHRNGKRVAIKMIHGELAISADTLKRFLREGYVANKVGHPGAVSVLDDDVADDGSPFVVMELLLGKTLEQRWDEMEERLPADEVLAWMDQVLDILAAAHASGVIHRDIKPENIFVTNEGAVKLLDFGIARLRESGGKQQTQDGYFMGTPAFTPPEQARGQWDQVDARTDLWAVGATMFTLLSGRWVHHAETTSMQIIAVATQPAPLLSTVLPTAPAALAAVVDRALAFAPSGRWASAREMQAAVRGARAELPSELASTAIPIARTPSQRIDPTIDMPALDVRPTPQRTVAPVTQDSRRSSYRRVPAWLWVSGGVGLTAALAVGVFLPGPRAHPLSPRVAAKDSASALAASPLASADASDASASRAEASASSPTSEAVAPPGVDSPPAAPRPPPPRRVVPPKPTTAAVPPPPPAPPTPSDLLDKRN